MSSVSPRYPVLDENAIATIRQVVGITRGAFPATDDLAFAAQRGDGALTHRTMAAVTDGTLPAVPARHRRGGWLVVVGCSRLTRPTTFEHKGLPPSRATPAQRQRVRMPPSERLATHWDFNGII